MEQLISELKFTDNNLNLQKQNQDFYRDNDLVFYKQNFTKHLGVANTRYSKAFYFYKGDTIIGNSLQYYGEYTETEVQLLHNFIQPGYIVYDIGANIGYHTIGLAHKAKHVYAFEPNDNNFKLLDINTRDYKNVTKIDYAVSNEVGVAYIDNFVLGDTGNFGECKLSDTGQICRKTTIDQLVNDKVILPPHVIKIDVEGHEYEVIQGMDNTIKNNLPVILYEHLHGDNLPKVHEYLESLGYTIYWFPVPNYNPVNFYRNKTNIFGNGGVMNALAVPFHIEVNTNLPKKLHKNETWNDVVTRLTNANN